MNKEFDGLRFPSGRTVEQVKKDASRASKQLGISHKAALDAACAENGAVPPWEQAIGDLKRTGGFVSPGSRYQCAVCGESWSDSRNPLLTVQAEFEDGSEEHVHLLCAGRDSRYDFCRPCEHLPGLRVFLAEDLNDAGECPLHAGESEPDWDLDCSDEDIESYAEYIGNNS